MRTLRARAWLASLGMELGLALLLFVPAGTLRFREAWLYWLVFSALTLALTGYFLRRDPALIERRLVAGPAAEREPRQKILSTFLGLGIGALFVVPGLERRLHPSPLPLALVLLGDALVVAGFAVGFLALRANPFAAGTVTVEPGQPVISSGPYARVRHPLYAGGVLIFVGTPLALGSLAALAVALLLCGLLAARLLDEERHLAAHLPGYDAYRRRVRDRLVPYVW